MSARSLIEQASAGTCDEGRWSCERLLPRILKPGPTVPIYWPGGTQVNPNGVRYLYYGTAHDFPADSEVPLDLVRRALGELLASGGKRPESVTWQASNEPR